METRRLLFACPQVLADRWGSGKAYRSTWRAYFSNHLHNNYGILFED